MRFTIGHYALTSKDGQHQEFLLGSGFGVLLPLFVHVDIRAIFQKGIYPLKEKKIISSATKDCATQCVCVNGAFMQ